MDFDFRKLLYTIIAFAILILIGKIFIVLVPLFVILGVTIYIVVTVKRLIREKKDKKSDVSSMESYDDTHFFDDDDFSGEIIDVEYEQSDED